MSIVISILILSFLVFFHELGHFIFARRAGIIVEGFSVGFGPPLLKWQGEETLYSIRLIPFGGSCQMKGEDLEDESEGSFYAASVWGRFLTILAGPIFNIGLGLVLAITLIQLRGVVKPIVTEVKVNSPAYEAGIQVDDEILDIEGTKVRGTVEVSSLINKKEGKAVVLKVKHGEEVKNIKVTPSFDKENNYYYVGISVGKVDKVDYKNSIIEGYYYFLNVFERTMFGIQTLFRGQVPLQQMTGPVGIVRTISSSLDMNGFSDSKVLIVSILQIAIIISINLGLMNLIPFPGLDGSRLIFLTIEAILRRPISRKVEGYIHMVGMILLFSFMIFIVFKDVFQIFYS